MATYSVADAKANLPRLIDKAIAGEEVIITRHGKVVAELKSAAPSSPKPPTATYAWLRAQRQAGPVVTISSVELLNRMYDDPSE